LENPTIGALTKDGALLALSNGGPVEVWLTHEGRKQMEIPENEDQPVGNLSFDAAGRRIITTTGKKTPMARVWDARTGTLLQELRGHTNSLVAATFSPDGLLALTASRDNTVRLWRLADGQAIATLRGSRELIHDASFSPDGQRVLATSSDGTARIFDTSLYVSMDQLRAMAGRRTTRELTASERQRFLH
jgi:WD40 repeat protein